MKPTPVMQLLKSELIKAFKASGLRNAEFARRTGCSEPMALRLRDPAENCHIDTTVRGLAALGKRVDIKVVALLLALTSPPTVLAQPPCQVIAEVIIHTYDGGIEIDELCMTVTSYASVPGGPNTPGQKLRVEAVDLSDGIFRNDFDP